MYTHDTSSTYPFRDLLQLSGRFVVPAGCDGLRNEAMPCEIDRVCPFGDFCSGKTVAICGEGLDGVLSAVWCVEEGRSIEVAFYVADLHIQGSGDTMARRISSSRTPIE